MRLVSVAGHVAVALSCGSLFACATADVMRLGQARRPPRQSSSVQVFVEEPARPYTTIAIVNVDDHGWDRSLAALESKLVDVAAAEGGDAVIIEGHSRDPRGAIFVPISGTWHGVPVIRKAVVGKVIAFTDN
jgi:hypothetical protein